MLLNWLMFALAAVPTQAACLTDAPSGCNAQICIVRGTDQDCTAHVCVVRGEDETCTPHVITLREMGDGPALWHARAGAPGLVLGGPVTAQVFIAGDEGQEAKVWIGVRLTPVPAPLAAHLGKEGAMVANVVKASPADEAGLKQFDVIVRFGEQEIKAPTDLTEAVADAEAGQAVKVTLTREARRQTVELTPIERPKDLRWEMKYEEPEDAFADAAVKARGRMMQLGPDGRWIIKDLGPMPGFPLEFEHLYGLKDQLGGLEDLRDLDVRILRKLDPEAEGDAKIELRVKVDKDGETTVIETGPGDEITVARKGPDGRETTKTYKSAAELEEADPEAYELYSHHAEGRADVLRVVPRGPEGRELRRKFQVNVEKRVKEALERAREAEEKAERAARESADTARDAAVKAREAYRRQRPVSPPPQIERAPRQRERQESGKWSVRITDAGTIRVTVNKDGEQRVLEFKDRQAFREAEPEIYEQVKSLFE